MLAFLALRTLLPSKSDVVWVCNYFTGVGFQQVYRATNRIIDVGGYESTAAWKAWDRPGDLVTKSVWQEKGQTPDEDSDQPTWQTEVDPLGDTGHTQVPFPNPNPFTMPPNTIAIWQYTVTFEAWSSDWSKMELDTNYQFKHYLRYSDIVANITSQTIFASGHPED